VSAKLDLVLALDSLARRGNASAIAKLEEQIAAHDKVQVIEQVAYTWFNRFCALRYMDVKGYSRIGVLSPVAGQFQPEILAEAKGGYVDEDVVKGPVREQIFALLDGSAPSADGQTEAYRLLIVAVCNDYHRIMPYLFERIDDYTELLMPDDLLSGNSIVAYTREAMTPDTCKDVEVIGWLYQFYISEKKDEVFARLKKNKKITPENIPAATQLFTPHWIVRYLVENSLGRLWLLNRPGSGLKAQMDYYIEPEQAETDFLQVASPEELKICDPACGSGHMLVYAFDLLYAIYEDEGYAPEEIPGKILICNLYGIEIDERAGTLAAFALTMKAREKQRGFFRKAVEPNICVLENVRFAENELTDYMNFIGRDLFTAPLLETLHQFREADNLGSLIRPRVTDVGDVLALLEQKDVAGQLLLYQIHQKVLKVLRQADYLSPKYQAVVANPPYMGGKGMNGLLGSWVKDNFPVSKSDLFAVFIERNLELCLKQGMVGMITMQSWMFLSSFEKLRIQLLAQNTITSMAHLGTRAFDSIGGEVVSTTAFVLENLRKEEYKGSYFRLIDHNSEAEKEEAIKEAIANPNCGWFYRASSEDFKKIPGSVIAYWLPKEAIEILDKTVPLGCISSPRKGMCTRDNDYFVRSWPEVSLKRVGFLCASRDEASSSATRWFPYQKGGEFRQWYGNHNSVVDWENDGYRLLHMTSLGWKGNSTNHNLEYIFRPAVVWSKITAGIPNFRHSPHGFLYDDASGLCSIHDESDHKTVLGFLCSKVGRFYMGVINPTLNIQPGNMASMPFLKPTSSTDIDRILHISKSDWDSYEHSWDFSESPLLSSECHSKINAVYSNWQVAWNKKVDETRRLEECNNQFFIDAYGLQDFLSAEVPLSEVTLTCNPHYRYDSTKPEAELEALLLADTMREFISYAVGCMFGRYSLDAPGLILANQGETLADYLAKIPNPTFRPDVDNVIPILEDEWFTDDITERFYSFLRTTFGTDHYTENLKFIEDAIGKDIRKFFLKDFYTDHIKRYKKRPIYWLFSSPKGTFNALIYMHRYRPDTVSVILNDYLREFQTKLSARQSYLETLSISESASPSEKTKALRDIEKLKKDIVELKDYERQTLYPLATQQIEIDLDDGVKVNYPKFGKALKKVPGLS